MFDFLVIGSGAIGLATAFRLKALHPDASVAAVGSSEYSGASVSAGAMLGAFGEVTKYTFAHPAGVARFDLVHRAHQAWPAWLDEVEEASGERVRVTEGTHVVLNALGGMLDEENYQSVLNALDRFHEPYEVVDPRSIPGIAPSSIARPLRALYLPAEGALDSRSYLSALEKACDRTGVERRVAHLLGPVTQTVDGFSVDDGHAGTRARKLIYAAGAATKDLLDRSGLPVDTMPMLAGVGVAMTTRRHRGEPFRHSIRTSNRAGSCGLHLVPFGDGREYVGATNVLQSAPESRPNLGMSHFLSDCAIEQLSNQLYFSTIEEWHVGNRPVSLDTFPLIGRTQLGDVFVATATYRDGLHCSPVIADHVAAIADDGVGPVSDQFRPDRDLIQTSTQQESAREFAMQEVAWAYETKIRLPFYMNEQDIFDDALERAESLYARLGTQVALNPDILIFLTSPESASSEVQRALSYLSRPGAR